MLTTEHYIKQCIDLAKKGKGNVAPNPMVGCVIVHNENVIGQGFHEEYGKEHAEVNAINSVNNKDFLKTSTLYVNLEPCSHYGKTPPCSDLIIHYKIPHVVIGCQDTNVIVSGKGIEKLRKAGCKVEVGILERECKQLNKRFFTFHEKKRPYIILKWAQTQDQFIDTTRKDVGKQLKITSPETDKLVHEWRTQEMAILIGANTAIMDDPQLTVRHINGKNPIRILIDQQLKTPVHHKLFDGSVRTLVFNSQLQESTDKVEYVFIEKKATILQQVLHVLYKENITSVIVEGGATTINGFIKENLWDEARIITNTQFIQEGVKAPVLQNNSSRKCVVGNDTIQFYYNSEV